MRRYIINVLFVVGVLALMTSCEKDVTSYDDSHLIYYVNIQLEGDEFELHPVGTEYVDPGFVATDNEVDVTGKVVVSGSVDGSQLGLYEIAYSAVSNDGYSTEKVRQVVVYDPETPENTVAGKYTTVIVRTEAVTKPDPNPRTYLGEIQIDEVGPGIFYVSCLLGGTYSIHYGYGANYAMTGYVALNPDNTFKLLSSYIKGWGDGLEGFRDGIYDPETGVLQWISVYAGADDYKVTSTPKN